MNLSSLPTAQEWLTLSVILFSIGIYGILTRKNAIGVLISVEILLNAAALNFVIMNTLIAPARTDGTIMAVFVIAVAAAEVVVAMAILVALFRHRRSLDVTEMHELKDN